MKVKPSVYRLIGATASWESELMASHLWLGDTSVISHLAAAALWGLPGFRAGPIELSTTRWKKPLPPVVVHRLSQPLDADTTTVGSIPVTNPGRTLCDLSTVIPTSQLERAVEDALRRRITSVGHLRWLCARASDGGRCRTFRRIVGAAEETPTESDFETRLLQAIRNNGLPEPVRQFEIYVCGRFIARVDFAYPWARVAVEADSYTFHSGRMAWEADLERRNALTARGWLVIHVTYRQMQSDMDSVAVRIKDALTPSLELDSD